MIHPLTMAKPMALSTPHTEPKADVSPVAIYPTSAHHTNHPFVQLPPSPPTTPQPFKPSSLTVSARTLMHHPLVPEFLARYTLGQELGSGGFGFVVSAVDRQRGVECAVKFILRSKVPAHAWVRDRELGPVPMEIHVLKHIRHENVVNFIDFYQDEVFLYLVMELHGTQWVNNSPETAVDAHHVPALSQTSIDSCLSQSPPSTPVDAFPQMFTRRTSCDLFECIERHHHFDEPTAKLIFKQIVDCVAYLDRLGICHRDLKDENIVIDDQYKVKLIDFGSAVILPRQHAQRNDCYFDKFYGTVSFASPEILMCRPYRAEPAEVWALGVLLYTILFGQVPFNDPVMAIRGRIAKPKIRVSPTCLNLLSCMFELSPERRPTVHQIQSHPWLQEP